MKTTEEKEASLLAKNIQNRRIQLGFTSAEKLAEASNISVSAIKKVESGINFPRMKTLIAIANALNCTFSDLFKSKQDENINSLTTIVRNQELEIEKLKNLLNSLHYKSDSVISDEQKMKKFSKTLKNQAHLPWLQDLDLSQFDQQQLKKASKAFDYVLTSQKESGINLEDYNTSEKWQLLLRKYQIKEKSTPNLNEMLFILIAKYLDSNRVKMESITAFAIDPVKVLDDWLQKKYDNFKKHGIDT